MDLGLTVISLLGLLAVTVVGTSLVAKEIERRTIRHPGAPVCRTAYLVGKWAGLTAALWTVAVMLGTTRWRLGAGARGAGADGGRGRPARLSLAVVTALAVMFSSLSTPVLSALYTLGFYCLGQWSGDLRGFAAAARRARCAPCWSRSPTWCPTCRCSTSARWRRRGTPSRRAAHLGAGERLRGGVRGCVLALAAAAFESRDFK